MHLFFVSAIAFHRVMKSYPFFALSLVTAFRLVLDVSRRLIQSLSLFGTVHSSTWVHLCVVLPKTPLLINLLQSPPSRSFAFDGDLLLHVPCLQRFRSLQVSCSSIFSHQGSLNSVAVRNLLRSFFDLTHDSARLASSRSIESLAGPQSRSGQRWLRISLRTALCRSMESSSRLPCSSHSLVTISGSMIASVLSLSSR